ncbi:MAG: (2Fe-2S)-binding protein [Coriobacteriales bacterium]|jgi:xanthine dehydrogenase YagT iron-sulfur-binding subunit|nr:(2Fe-2S)-binding protein [Coriobacteriales bacterium]
METHPKTEDARALSRRNFLRGSGLAAALAAGAAASGTTAAVASLVGCTPTEASEVGQAAAPFDGQLLYTCPIDGKTFTSYEALKQHFAESHPERVVPEAMKLSINGAEYVVQVEPQWTLREALQYAVGLTGNAKEMCGRGECGSCTVLIDGAPALSCTTLAIECEGRLIETAEGIAADPDWAPLVDAYVKWDTMQCGYCTPGNLTMAKYILTQNPSPTADDIRFALSGNICRCGTYSRHVSAIQEAAEKLKGGN